MINRTDDAYQDLLKKIIVIGKEKGDRTGTGTISIFSHTLEIDMADGFPLLTTKKMFTKGIIHELLWFLKGDTNIQYLVKNGVNIWTPDAYREYKNYASNVEEPDYGIHVDDPMGDCTRIMTIDEFKERIINNDEFAEMFGELGPIYGKQWVNWEGIDTDSFINSDFIKDEDELIGRGMFYSKNEPINQIQNAIDTLNNNPDSRRIMVSAWNVGEISEMALPPCHYGFELYTEELTGQERFNMTMDIDKVIENQWDLPNGWGTLSWGDNDSRKEIMDKCNIPTRRLSLKWHQRSVDTFLGLPFNIASYGLLLEMFAQQTNMVAGTLIGDLTNVHIYKNHIEQCKKQLSREPLELPTLELNKVDSIFDYCYEDVKILNYSSHPAIKGDISV